MCQKREKMSDKESRKISKLGCCLKKNCKKFQIARSSSNMSYSEGSELLILSVLRASHPVYSGFYLEHQK